MEKNSLLAELLSSQVDKVREEITSTPIQELLQAALEEVGLFVFTSAVDCVDGNEATGTLTVATDGAPERAKAAVEEILRFHGISEFDWSSYPPGGQVSVCWEILDDSK